MPRSVASSLSSGSSSSSSQGKRSRAPSSVSLSARPATVEEVGEDVYGEASEDVNEGGENEEDDEEEEGTKPFPRRLDVRIFTSITNFRFNTGMNILIINERPNLLAQKEEEEEEVLPVTRLDIQQVPQEDTVVHREGMTREKEEWKVKRVNGERKLKVKLDKYWDFG
ncbi:hypothetical protein EAF00_003467 [Botryotinia globosa]|nr:hypothetical protein EAF00_003467 [Botryotinia globosa]